jgi:hypothetical protein
MAWPYAREALAGCSSFGRAPAPSTPSTQLPAATLPSPEVAAWASLGSPATLRAVLFAELERCPQAQEIICRCARRRAARP